MNWLTKNISESVNDFVSGGLNFFESTIMNVFDHNVELFTATEIATAELVIKSIAIVLVVIMILKEIFTTYVMETDGDPDADPMELLVRASVVLALIEGNSLIFDELQVISRKLTKDLVGTCSAKAFTVKMESLLANMVIENTAHTMTILTLAGILILMVVFVFKSGIRGGELMLARLLWPIFAIDKLKANAERWNAFVTTYVVTFVSYSLQLFLIRLGINRVISAMTEGGVEATFLNYFAGIVLFFLAIKTPKWLEKFVYSSGLGQMAGNAGRSLTYMIPSMLMRR